MGLVGVIGFFDVRNLDERGLALGIRAIEQVGAQPLYAVMADVCDLGVAVRIVRGQRGSSFVDVDGLGFDLAIDLACLDVLATRLDRNEAEFTPISLAGIPRELVEVSFLNDGFTVDYRLALELQMAAAGQNFHGLRLLGVDVALEEAGVDLRCLVVVTNAGRLVVGVVDRRFGGSHFLVRRAGSVAVRGRAAG